MAELTVATLLGDLQQYRYDPTNFFRVGAQAVQSIYDGDITLVDAASPLAFLLEMSAVNTVAHMQQHQLYHRKQYPVLAQSMDDVFMHMSDKDYAGRFATPAKTKFTFAIHLAELRRQAKIEPNTKAYRVTIPRDTNITVDNTVFTMAYPIDIRLHANGSLQVSYDASVDHPLVALTESIIQYAVFRDTEQVEWLVFEAHVEQYDVESISTSLIGGAKFTQAYQFNDRYYYTRVFYRNDSNSTWREMRTTHSEQVFDPRQPTMLLRVQERDEGSGTLEVTLPTIYQSNGLTSAELRIDIYTTKGAISMNLDAYRAVDDVFSTRLTAIDDKRDENAYTAAMRQISYRAYSSTMVNGGSNGVGFTKLRDQVVNNAVGENDYPITDVQLANNLQVNGFNLIANVDVLTNRIFLATKRLPRPLNEKLITAANIGIGTLVLRETDYAGWPSIARNGKRTTLLPRNVYVNRNSVLSIKTPTELATMASLPVTDRVEAINSQDLTYTPFYYVLDNSNKEFAVRAYHLDAPAASGLSFESSNETLQLIVNTAKYQFEKIAKGYRLTLETRSGNYYKGLEDIQVGIQLALSVADGGNASRAYIEGKFVGLSASNERIYQFDIETNHDIDSNNRLIITNAHVRAESVTEVMVDLSSRAQILHYTKSIPVGYRVSDDDSLLAKFFHLEQIACQARETLTLQYGIHLKNLWSRSRIMPAGMEYEVWEDDVPLVAEEDVYVPDPVTGADFKLSTDGTPQFTFLYHKGDILKDEQGNIKYKHRKGTVKTDTQGQPIIKNALSSLKEVDLLMVDGRYYFANDENFVGYRKELAGVLAQWASGDLSNVEQVLLEQTRIFYYPETTLNSIRASVDGTQLVVMDAKQQLDLVLYVPRRVYESDAMRETLKINSIRLLDEYIQQSVVNKQDIADALKKLYGDTVESFTLNGLGGQANYTLVKTYDQHARLCLAKRLELQDDNSLIVKEAVSVSFVNTQEKTVA